MHKLVTRNVFQMFATPKMVNIAHYDYAKNCFTRQFLKTVVLIVLGVSLLYLVTILYSGESPRQSIEIDITNGTLRDTLCSDFQNTCFDVYDISQNRYLLTRGDHPFVTTSAVLDDEKVDVKLFPRQYAGALLAAPLLLGTLHSIEDPGVSILNIGLGGGETHAYVANLPPDRQPRIVTIELDSIMVLIAQRWFGVPPNNVKSYVQIRDGVEFLKTNTEKFDLIILDACFSPLTEEDKFPHCPSKVFRTPKVIKSIKQSLKPNGVLSVNYFDADKLFDKFYNVFKKHFRSNAAFKVNFNTISCFSDAVINMNKKQEVKRLRHLENITDEFSSWMKNRIW